MPVDEPLSKNIPLLEIDAIQLDSLFGAGTATNKFRLASLMSASDLSDEDVDRMSELDVYAIPERKRHELFVRAAFQAVLGRDPSGEESGPYLEMLAVSGNSYQSIMKELIGIRDDTIRTVNNARKESVALTMSEIDRWAGHKRGWWK